MKKLTLLGIWILVLAVSASAEVVNYELNTVSRIVGASPQEMKDSLTINNIDIKHATFVSNELIDNGYFDEKTRLINGYTKNSFTSNYETYQTDKWQKNKGDLQLLRPIRQPG